MKEKVLGIFEFNPAKESQILIEGLTEEGSWDTLAKVQLREGWRQDPNLKDAQPLRVPFLIKFSHKRPIIPTGERK